MPGKRLAELEKEANREQAAALRFIAKEELGSLPGRRSETGESSGAQRVGHHGDATRPDTERDNDGLKRAHREPLSYDAFGGIAQYEDWLLDNNQQYLPLVGADAPPPSFEDLDRRARMNHVMSFLPEGQRRDMERKHLEQMTLQQIADEDGVSRQAVHKRLKRAEVAFKASFAEHWEDELVVEDW